MSPGSLNSKVQCLAFLARLTLNSQDGLRESIWDQIQSSFQLHATKLIKSHKVHSDITEKN